MKWLLAGPLACFDVESTGISVENDRIVTATVGLLQPGTPWAVDTRSWMIDPGIDIPEAASNVHGITTLQAKEHGQQPDEVLPLLAHDLARAFLARTPVVGMNLVFDFTMLDRELRRHGLPTLDERLGRPIAPVVDVLVLDKFLDPYRKGGRKLTTLCEHFGVRIDGAHDSAFDALAAARIAYRIAWLAGVDRKVANTIPADRWFPALGRISDRSVAGRFAEIASFTPTDLHDAQVVWRREQCDSLRAHFDKRRTEHDGVPGDWPMLPWATTDEAVLTNV